MEEIWSNSVGKNSIPLWQNVPLARGNGPEDTPRLTPYLVEGSHEPTACVVICPGGGYGMRAHHEGEPVARWLNGLGISAFVLDYRVAPYRHPAPLLDAMRAIRLVRYNAEHWNIGKNRVGILGFSAGGHLAATAGTHFDFRHGEPADDIDHESARPDLMILCYPVISFGVYRHHGSMVNLIGETPDKDVRDDLSNELQVTKDTPPTFIWHTADDEGVPAENSVLFATALSQNRVPYELHVYPHGRHGVGLASEESGTVSTWPVACARWLQFGGF